MDNFLDQIVREKSKFTNIQIILAKIIRLIGVNFLNIVIYPSIYLKGFQQDRPTGLHEGQWTARPATMATLRIDGQTDDRWTN